MLLLIDAGNTRIKWAVAALDAAPGHWLAQGAVAHDELAQVVPQWRGISVVRTLVSNVAGAAMAARIAESLAAAGVTPESIEWFRSTPARAGVINGYREPAQLGCDRFASLIGARHRHPGRPLLVVTCGTATTIDPARYPRPLHRRHDPARAADDGEVARRQHGAAAGSE